jgi:hypothetical protein
MTPTGKRNILAAIDILVDTDALLESDAREAISIIKNIPVEINATGDDSCTAKPTSNE